MIFILYEWAYFLLVINSNLGPVSYHLVTIVHTDLLGHLRLMIFVSPEMAYATSC